MAAKADQPMIEPIAECKLDVVHIVYHFLFFLLIAATASAISRHNRCNECFLIACANR